MSFVSLAREKQAQSLIKAFEKRNMTAFYCPTKKDCLEKVLELLPENSTIAWGGSESIKEIGIPKALKESGSYTVYDRADYTSEEQAKQFKSLAFGCNYYFMSSNAITLDGMLVNIDGNGNRVANLIYGPDHVIVVAGMNKVTSTLEAAFDRVRNVASPPNTIRLSKNTPCATSGKCENCFSPDCICNQFVITRRSREKERIIVLLVGEELGF